MGIFGKDPFEDIGEEILGESIWGKPSGQEPQIPQQQGQEVPGVQQQTLIPQQVPVVTPQVVPQIPFPPTFQPPAFQYSIPQQIQQPQYQPSPQVQQPVERKREDKKKKEEVVRKASYILNFKLGEEFYGVDVENIREVVRTGKITPVPNVHYHVLGIMNLRGRIFPVISLRRFFGMEDLDPEKSKKSKILVVEDEEGFQFGVFVDDVSEVSVYYVDELEPITSVKFSGSKYARGVLRRDNKPIVVIDIKEIMKESLVAEF
jgi:purine-binding chemotaxis protein CheW